MHFPQQLSTRWRRMASVCLLWLAVAVISGCGAATCGQHWRARVGFPYTCRPWHAVPPSDAAPACFGYHPGSWYDWPCPQISGLEGLQIPLPMDADGDGSHRSPPAPVPSPATPSQPQENVPLPPPLTESRDAEKLPLVVY